ncbi:hypothetical protein ACI65C_010230 [Semiaphis heraclei]
MYNDVRLIDLAVDIVTPVEQSTSTDDDDTGSVCACIHIRRHPPSRRRKGAEGSALRCRTKRHPGDRSNGLYVMDFRASA